MLSIREQIIKENITRTIGNRPEADLIFRVQTGKITKEEIEEYERKRDEETQYFKEFFEFDKPQLPSVFEPEPNQSVIISNIILKDTTDNDNSIRRDENQGDENTIPINQAISSIILIFITSSNTTNLGFQFKPLLFVN